MRLGIIASLVVALMSFFTLASPSTQPSKPDAKTLAVYDRIKALAGQWEGKSSKGWTEILDIDVIASGSCVLERSRFAHGNSPDSGMATMYHLDGPNLLLTHYCMAKNQPRLKATEISDDSKTVVFTFLDGTGMASRDVGHMDKVKIMFEDDKRFKSQWTFYKDGEEKWMEAITYSRVEKPASETQTK